MQRRQFLRLFGSTPVWPLAAAAQQPAHRRHIGVLVGSVSSASDAVATETLRPFKKAMRDAGWIEGETVDVDYRFGGDIAKINASAVALVALNPELIFAQGLPAARAIAQDTARIPIVFTQVADPVGFGLVHSISHPGGNATGFVVWELSIGSKWMQLLRQIAPDVSRVGVIYNPDTASYAPPIIASAKVAAGNDVTVIPLQLRADGEIGPILASFAKEPHSGLLVIPEPFTAAHRDQIINWTSQLSLPNLIPLLDSTKHGALMSYNYSFEAIMSEPVAYIDRILKGQAPGDLPVQAPTKFELSINMKTAKTLGLTVSPTLLATADEVIE